VGLWATARYARSDSPAPGAAAMASFMLLTIIGWLIQ
jgi:hypothetical protein